MTELTAYYSARAAEYEAIYKRDDPIRQAELLRLASEMRGNLAGRNVLEVACGTGFWTEKLADVAASVTALDASDEMLEIARSKDFPLKVTFAKGDAYKLGDYAGSIDAILACFWFSHIPKRRIHEFLDGAEAAVGRGGIIFLADNVFQHGIGGELVTKSRSADTYKRRQLADGSTWEVLKNYYTETALRKILEPRGSSVVIKIGNCYWWASYIV